MPSLTRLELAACAVLAVAAAVLGVRHLQARADRERPPVAAVPGPPVLADPGPREVREVALVHVAGAVRDPGVIELRAGARVRDAVRAAGGVTARAEVDRINLAAKVADGQQVVVPERVPAASGGGGEAGAPGPAAPTAGAGSASSLPTGPLSLGSATLEQLDGLDGIGPGLAERIIAFRDEHGGFSSVDQLAEVPGIGPKRLEALREVVAP